MSLIEVRELRREFKILEHQRGLLGAMRNLFSSRGHTVAAVDSVSFDVEEGEFVGYVGPNGAGKSTTIKMLTGILVPTSGRANVAGRVPHEDRARNALGIGVVFGQRTQLWWDLPPIEAFDLLGRMYRVTPGRLKEQVEFFTELLELGDLLDTPVRKLSLGQKMRCELTAALLHDPAILFLDEPTIGLDVVAKEQVRSFLKTINRERGTTILLTSHDLDDIERLCQRVIVIDQGRIIQDGSLSALRARSGTMRRVVVDCTNVGTPELPPGARVSGWEGRRLSVEFDTAVTTAPAVVTALLDSLDVIDLTLTEVEIEEVIRRIYEGQSESRSD